MKLLDNVKFDTNEEKYISLSGFRTLIVFQALLYAPKTLDEIKNIILRIDLTHEDLSDDAVRICINNLREAGCEITKATKTNDYKYTLISNPLEFDISYDEICVIKNVFQKILDTNSINDLEKFEAFVNKLISIVSNNETKEILSSLIIIGRLNPVIYKQIRNSCLKKSFVTMKYLTAGSEVSKEIKIFCNNLFIRSEKIYFDGFSPQNNKNQFFLVDRIEQIISEEKSEMQIEMKDYCAICEIYDEDYKPQENETVLNRCKKYCIVKFTENNSFILRQKILHFADLCKVIYPIDLQKRIKNILEETRKVYDKQC